MNLNELRKLAYCGVEADVSSNEFLLATATLQLCDLMERTESQNKRLRVDSKLEALVECRDKLAVLQQGLEFIASGTLPDGTVVDGAVSDYADSLAELY